MRSPSVNLVDKIALSDFNNVTIVTEASSAMLYDSHSILSEEYSWTVEGDLTTYVKKIHHGPFSEVHMVCLTGQRQSNLMCIDAK